MHVVPTSPDALHAACKAALASDPEAPVKIGMLANIESIRAVSLALAGHKGLVVADPVMGPSAGGSWAGEKWASAYLELMAPVVGLLAPNLGEAQILAGKKNAKAKQCASLLAKKGFANIVVKGANAQQGLVADLLFSGGTLWWLCGKMIDANARGTGCTHTTTICAALALGETIGTAIVLGKMQAQAKLNGRMKGWPSMSHLPMMSSNNKPVIRHVGNACAKAPIGVCAIVNDPMQIKPLAKAGIQGFQLRVKGADEKKVLKLAAEASRTTSSLGATLYVNDHWQACCKMEKGSVSGVHLGQQDLQGADLQAIRDHGLAIGITASSHHEAAVAMAAAPSYISFGPVFETKSKALQKRPLGILRLARLCEGLVVPALAIGGINASNLAAVMGTGVSAIAAIEACSTPKKAGLMASAWNAALKKS